MSPLGDLWPTGPAQLSAAALLAGFVAVTAGGILWTTTTAADVGTARHTGERGLLMVALLLTAVGLVLLAAALRGTAAYRLALVGSLLYAAAGVLGLAHEAAILSPRFMVASWVVAAHVVGAFLGQATVGLALTRAAGFPPAVGWVVLTWNLAWVGVLPLATPDDVYFPVLHHLMGPVIAIPLLAHG